MFDVIDFLENVGQDAQWRHAGPEALAVALIEAQIAPELRAAIIAKDGERLGALLGQVPFCCYINPGKEDDDEDEGEDESEDKDKVKKVPRK
jgi:hypothetical protein